MTRAGGKAPCTPSARTAASGGGAGGRTGRSFGLSAYHWHEGFVSRSKGGSAVKTSAYISGERMVDERTGEVCEYARKERVRACGIELPENAPHELADPSVLWNSVERAERAANSQTARRINASLPRGLSENEQVLMARAMAKDFARKGMCVQWAIHTDERDHNPHVHFLTTLRALKDGATYDAERPGAIWEAKTRKNYICRMPDGTKGTLAPEEIESSGAEKTYKYRREGRGGKDVVRWLAPSEVEADTRHAWERVSRSPRSTSVKLNRWSSKDELVGRRKQWSRVWNATAHRIAMRERMPEPEPVSHLSYEERGIDLVPTLHVGSGPNRSGFAAEWNRRVMEAREAIRSAEASIARLRREIVAQGRLRHAGRSRGRGRGPERNLERERYLDRGTPRHEIDHGLDYGAR